MTPWRRPAVAMVGQGPELSHLRRQADVLGVGDLIDFRDDVTHQSWVCALLKSADLFVLPPVREGFGIAVLEALACGLPVITTSAPDNHAQVLVRRTGRGLVCAPTSAALAAAVRAWVEGTCAQEGPAPSEHEILQIIRQYDWENVVDVMASALGVTRG